MPEEAEERKEFVTLDELCGEDQERDQAETYLPRYGKWVRHRTRVPLGRLIKAQNRYMRGKNRDLAGFMTEMLAYLMLEPRVQGTQQAQMLLHADGRVMLEILNDAIGDVSDMMEETEEEAGE